MMKTHIKLVVLDPGHGDHDPGALGPNGTRESERALEVCLRAEEMLDDYVDVILTRHHDETFVELSERPAIANREKADVFVSYHFNSSTSPNTALSYEGFTTPGQNRSDILAQKILDAHGKLCPWQKLRADRADGDDDKEANFAVLRPTKCPSMLMEGEFIHTVEGEQSINNPEHQHRRALAVAIGVLDFLEIEHDLWREAGSTFEPPAGDPLPKPPIAHDEAKAALDAIAWQVEKLRGLLDGMERDP